MKAKFDNKILLKLAMKELKTNVAKFTEKYKKILDVDNALYISTNIITSESINPKTGEKLFKKEDIYSTSTAIVKTTQHGRVLDIQFRKGFKLKPKNVANVVDINKRNTTVTVKKRRVINKI